VFAARIKLKSKRSRAALFLLIVPSEIGGVRTFEQSLYVGHR
jgi:hypothetical protein